MTSILPIPSEFEIAGTYFAPLMLSIILGLLGMVLTTWWLNRHRLLRYVFFPNVVTLAITCIYSVIIATFVIPA